MLWQRRLGQRIPLQYLTACAFWRDVVLSGAAIARRGRTADVWSAPSRSMLPPQLAFAAAVAPAAAPCQLCPAACHSVQWALVCSSPAPKPS